ncbi:ATP-binding protein [Legionella sp. km772]|uniref:sensor histidine kinase n=1 Tax=Legionella sp. km772 TaxID=2498111 RepID=UPI000F8E765A|nr:ATP-binding protein [Legionella sp. km772]RUR04746.1 PAS domain-containing sensor histidine kinase [Legionella sp. km772]
MYRDNKNEPYEIQALYREIYELNNSLYITIDGDFIIQELNFKAADFLGRDRSLFINQSFLKYMTLFSQDLFINTVEQFKHKKFTQTCEIELLAKGGERKQVHLEISYDWKSQIRLCLNDLTYINQQNSLIQSLEHKLTLFEQLLNETEEGIAVLTSDLNFKTINKAFYTLFLRIFLCKVEVGTNLEKSLVHYSKLKTKVFKAFHDALAGHEQHFTIENTKYNEEVYYYYEIKMCPIKKELNKKQLIFRIRDLSEYKFQEIIRHHQQAKIESSTRLSTMEEMISAIAHEVNQPLTVINTYSKTGAYLLTSELSLQEKTEKLGHSLAQISMQAEHAGKIIYSMRNLLFNEEYPTEPCDINALIKNTILLLNYEFLDSKITTEFLLMDSPPLVKINKIQIMQVLLNLTRNSIEAFKCAEIVKPTITIQTRNLHSSIMVIIKDNGPGISVENKSKLLNTYFTTKPQGDIGADF